MNKWMLLHLLLLCWFISGCETTPIEGTPTDDYFFSATIESSTNSSNDVSFRYSEDHIFVGATFWDDGSPVGSISFKNLNPIIGVEELDTLNRGFVNGLTAGHYFVNDFDLIRQIYMVTPPHNKLNLTEITENRVTITFDSLLFTKTRPDSPGQSFVDSFYMTDGRIEAGPEE